MVFEKEMSYTIFTIYYETKSPILPSSTYNILSSVSSQQSRLYLLDRNTAVIYQNRLIESPKKKSPTKSSIDKLEIISFGKPDLIAKYYGLISSFNNILWFGRARLP